MDPTGVDQTGIEPKHASMILLPHQAAFVETSFDFASKRIILLRSGVGLGKTAALLALVRRLLAKRPAARVLFLVSIAVLRQQIVERLCEAGSAALSIDRYRFREMLDSAAEGEFYPRGTVIVLSIDFATQSDIGDSLAKTHWDLIVADDVQSLSGSRVDILRRVAASAEQVVFTALSDTHVPDSLSAEGVTVVDWRRDQLVNHDGTPLDSVPRPLLQEVAFPLTPAELNVGERVGALCQLLEGGTRPQSLIAASLSRSLHSSPAALERVLQRLAEALDTNNAINASPEPVEEELFEDAIEGQADLAIREEVVANVALALQEIEKIRDDSKLEAFGALLSNIGKVKPVPTRICVITEYLETLYYLAAEIEGRPSTGRALGLMHGGMSAHDRHESLSQFRDNGGVLLATMHILKGIDLRMVTDLVLYDLPGGLVPLQVLLARFDRFGRRDQLNVHVLVPSNHSASFVTDRLSLVHELLPNTRNRVGVLAYGSLIADPGPEISPLIESRIQTTTPFPVEYGRLSAKTRGGAPTLVPHQAGCPVEAQILLLKDRVSTEEAKSLLWRRERRKEGSGDEYVESSSPNAVLIHDLPGTSDLDHLLYTDFNPEGKLNEPDPLTLAQAAIDSVAIAQTGKDGISYLMENMKAGIVTPLTPRYQESILALTKAADLAEALESVRERANRS